MPLLTSAYQPSIRRNACPTAQWKASPSKVRCRGIRTYTLGHAEWPGNGLRVPRILFPFRSKIDTERPIETRYTNETRDRREEREFYLREKRRGSGSPDRDDGSDRVILTWELKLAFAMQGLRYYERKVITRLGDPREIHFLGTLSRSRSRSRFCFPFRKKTQAASRNSALSVFEDGRSWESTNLLHKL